MTNYFCPECGELLMINGHCWACHWCGAGACGLGSVIADKEISCHDKDLSNKTKSGVMVEVREDDKTQSGGSADTPRGTKT